MASISEIPEELLSIEAKPQFIKWLTDIPVDVWVKRRLMHIYTESTGVRFDLIQTAILLDTGKNNNDTPQQIIPPSIA